MIIADTIHEKTYCDTEWPTIGHRHEHVAPAVGVSRMSTFLQTYEGLRKRRTFSRRVVIGQSQNVGRDGDVDEF